jgi:zinc protease
MKKFLWLIFIGLLLSPVVYGQSSEFLQYDKNLIVRKLDNGLTYYIYPNTNPKGEAVYRLFVKAGSVMEKENQRGLAHFLEHMAFNGSYHFPSDGMVRFLESKGAKFGKDLNAHTSFNETVYKLQLPSSNPQMVDSTLTILADWAGGLSIDSMQVEKERGVILSEWLSKRDAKRDSDTAFLLELLNSSHYSERMTIGDTAVIRNCKREDILDYYQTWYHPSLMAVAVVGDINPEQVETLIKEKFGKLSSLASPIWKQCHIPVYKKEAVKILTNESLKTIELDMIQLLPLSKPVQTAKDYKAYLTRTLLNRLFKMRMNAWAFENPSYRKASIQYSSFLNATGVLLCSVELLPGKMEKGISEFIAQQQQIFRYGFTETEIERAKKVILKSATTLKK